MKKLGIFLLILAILGVLVYYFFPMEMVVKKAVNKYGSEVTGTDVNLSGFHLNLKNGEATVKEITVANPSTYKTKYAIQLDNIDVKVNLKSLTSDTIIVDKIVVNKPVVSYEMMSLTQNNIADIINNVNKYTAISQSETAEEKANDGSSSKKVIIKEVVISNGEINGAMTAAPDVVSAAIALPTIPLNNLGEESDGITVSDAIALILNKLLSSVSTTVISSNIANLKGVVVDAAKEAAQDALDSAKEATNNAVDSVKDTLSGLNPFGE